MSKPDERLVEGVDYDHGDHDDRPWADDEDDWDSPHWDGNDVDEDLAQDAEG